MPELEAGDVPLRAATVLIKSLILIHCFLVQAPKPAPVPGMPAAAGVYYRQSDARWIKIESAYVDATKTKGLETFLQTDGLSNLGLTVVYLGNQAPLQILDRRPTLHVRGIGAAKDAMIIQLSPKKDSRTVRISSSASAADNKGGFKRGEIRRVTATVHSDGSFSITPEESLKPGEFLLVFGYPNPGFDFGIRKK